MNKWLDPATQFEELYQLEYLHVLHYIQKMTYVDAEDLTQDTFVKAYKARYRYVPKANPSAWLLMIARNTTISHIRHARDRNELEDKYTVLANYEAVEDRELVAALSTQLSPKQAEVLQLRYGEDLTLNRISQKLGIGYRTASSRHFSALERMRLAAAV